MTTASKITLVRVFLIPVYLVFMLLSANGAANDWMRWVQSPLLSRKPLIFIFH